MRHRAIKFSTLFIIRGILAILFGLCALLLPGMTLAILVLLWGAFALVDGVLTLYNAFKHKAEIEHWWIYLLSGVAGVGVGLITFAMPGLTTMVLLFLVAAWAILVGGLMIWAAIELRKEIAGEWLLGLAGLVSVLFGIYLIVRPAGGALAVAWLIGLWAIALGILVLMVGLKLRGLRKTVGERIHGATAA